VTRGGVEGSLPIHGRLTLSNTSAPYPLDDKQVQDFLRNSVPPW